MSLRTSAGRPRARGRAARFGIWLLAGLLGACTHVVAQDPILTPDEFIKRYGLIRTPPEDKSSASDTTEITRVEAAARFEDRATAGYRYAPSISAMVDVFRQRATRAPSPPRSPHEVQRAIDETFGVSLLGRGFHVMKREAVSSAADGSIHLIDFKFGNGGSGQALVGTPPQPNGVLLVAIHGCLSSPDDVMLDPTSYAHAFGLRAMERGYTVVAPYVLSACLWIHNLDWLGTLSGVSVFGYELSKIGQLTHWAKREYGLKSTVIWGISLGGQYSILSSALYRDLFDVTVISGATADYEAAYRADFEGAGVDGTPGKRLGTNTQVALSAKFARRDVIASIVPRPIIFEVSTADLAFAPATVTVVDYVDRTAQRKRAPRPEVVLFEGAHGTKPEATLDVIDRVSKTRGGAAR